MTRSSCDDLLPTALSSDRPSALLSALTALGCPLPRVACAAGASSLGGFRPGPNSITVDAASSAAQLTVVLTHELVHAFDACRARVDRCEHLACTEVRAAALSGECDGAGGAVSRDACVRRSAVSSVRSHGGCDARGGAEAGVAAVWAACAADGAPFEGSGWRGAVGAGGRKPELVAPHLVDPRAGLLPPRGRQRA